MADLQGGVKRAGKAAEYLGIGVSTLWRYTKTIPDFPKPVKLSSRTTVFLDSELNEWLHKQIAARRNAA